MPGSLTDEFKEGIKKLKSELSDIVRSNFSVDNFVQTAFDVDNLAVGVAKVFGQGRENINEIKASLTETVTRVTLLGGDINDIQKIIIESSKELGRNILLSEESSAQLFAAMKVTEKTIGEITSSFKDAGVSILDAAKNTQQVVDVARSMGLNVKNVSEQFLENLTAINKFGFENGIQGVAKMAAQAVNLRINMSDTLRLADDLFDPDKAITLAAAMQRLGVANSELLDPLRLMDLAQNDPTELQNQVVQMTKQFVEFNEETKRFEIPRGAMRQLREISKEIGISYDQLAKMAMGSAELDDKLSKIKFPDNAFTEEQRTFIANMAEMKDGEYKIRLSEGEIGLDAAIERLKDPKTYEEFKKASEPKTIEELTKEQIRVIDAMNKAIESLSKKLPMAFAGSKIATEGIELPLNIYKNIAEGLDEGVLSIKTITKGIDKSSEILDTLNDVLSGKGIEESFNKLRDSFSGSLPEIKKQLEITGDDFTKNINELINSENMFMQIIKNAGAQIIELFTQSGSTVSPQTGFSSVINNNSQSEEIVNKAIAKTEQNVTSDNKKEVTHNFNFNVSSPNPNLTPENLRIVFENTGFIQELIRTVKEVESNYGLS